MPLLGCIGKKLFITVAEVVAQLVEQSLTITMVRSSNPVIGKSLY